MTAAGVLLISLIFAVPAAVLVWFFLNYLRDRRRSERIAVFVTRLAPAEARKVHDVVSEAAIALASKPQMKRCFIELLHVLRARALGDGMVSGPRALIDGIASVATEIHGDSPLFRFGDAMTDSERSQIRAYAGDLLALCSNHRFESDALEARRASNARLTRAR